MNIFLLTMYIQVLIGITTLLNIVCRGFINISQTIINHSKRVLAYRNSLEDEYNEQ